MIINILEKAKIPYKILEFDRFRRMSRFKELMSSPTSLELMRILARDRLTAKDGRKKLQQGLELQEFCEWKTGMGNSPFTAPESTFRINIGRLVEYGLIEEQPRKTEGRYVNTYKLVYNLLLFKGERDNWVPTVIFTCPEKQAIVKVRPLGVEVRDEDMLSILPSSNFCVECKRKCELSQRLKRLDRVKKSLSIS